MGDAPTKAGREEFLIWFECKSYVSVTMPVSPVQYQTREEIICITTRFWVWHLAILLVKYL